MDSDKIDQIEWDPEWEEDDASNAAAYQQEEALDSSTRYFVNLGTTSSLLQLKGSLASILAAPPSTDLYAALINKLEKAVPEEDREDFAALLIQKAWRNVRARRKAKADRLARRLASIMLLQSTYRGHLARRFVLHLNKAAARIQGLARGHSTRKRLKAEKRKNCARKIQRWFRACITRDIMFRMKREQGATCLQRVYRGHLGRKSWRFRQQTLAANAVQRCVRGHEGRKSARAEMQRLAIARQKRMERAALKFQAIYRGFTCRKWIRRRMPALVLARRIRMVLRLQRAFRGYRGRLAYRMALQLQQMDVKSAALIPLQALARGHIIRQRLRDEAERVMAEEAASLASSLLLFRQNRSARIIQLGWRAWTAFKYEWAMNRFASRIQIWFRVRRMSSLGRMQRRKIFQSATKIQSVCMGHRGRNIFREFKRTKFATRIQATFRGHRERVVAFQLLREAREQARRERERRQRELEEERRQLAIIAQSNRGQIEVFVQEPTQSDASYRPAQIVPGYMKVIAEQEERVRRPTVSNAVLRGVTVKSNLSEVRAAGKLQAKSDDFGWQSVDPSVDPYEGLDLHDQSSSWPTRRRTRRKKSQGGRTARCLRGTNSSPQLRSCTGSGSADWTRR
uniref:Myosin motor domain-containing protein n=1 Tax=Guillardia theta TaxID=55529 RepID=A0A6U6CC63_GUITH|mmetsp:Transcript_44088/g.139129  ORF Transcript_44088/g.139129 Transcript_44088/m.139129 type:complete len:626 (+) Transcript_44088:200-2077(+)